MRQSYLFLAWFIALVALLVTLYSSNLRLLPVCHLCWFQRVCMYPLVIILGIGAFVGDFRSITYAAPLAVIGAILALFQYLLQWFPHWEAIGVCGSGPDCSATHIRYWGFITYPFISLLAFVVILILLSKARGKLKKT